MPKSGPGVRLYDAAGNPLSVLDGQVMSIVDQPGAMVSGYDRSNNRARFLNLDANGNLSVVSAGDATGITPGFADGYVATAVIAQVAVRATAYTEQTTDAQRSIVSANAADTAAGTGARTVRIRYGTAAYGGPFFETITLNGTTPVNTVATNICVIEEMEVLTAGSGGVNAGIITLRAATGGGGVVIGTIAAGDNKTFWSHHYTPVNVTSYITGISLGHNGTVVGSGALALIRAKDAALANSAERQVSDFVRLYGQSSTFSRNYSTAIRVIGPARTVLYMTPETSSAVIYRGSFDFYDQAT